MTKMLSASGGLRPPDPLTRGAAPGSRWGLCPQTPVTSSCSALAMVPPQPQTPSAAYGPSSYFPNFLRCVCDPMLARHVAVALSPFVYSAGVTWAISGQYLAIMSQELYKIGSVNVKG